MNSKSWPRFSMLTLSFCVALTAVACGTFSMPVSIKLSKLVLGLVVIYFFTALLGVVYRDGAKKAYWLGVAIFGFGYLVVAKTEILGLAIQPSMEDFVGWLRERMGKSESLSTRNALVPMGNAYAALLLAFTGGMIGQHFYRTTEGSRHNDSV